MRNLSLFISIILIFLYIITTHQQALWCGLTVQSAATHPLTRLSYMMMHDNIVHLTVNIYCLLSLSFLTDARVWQFVVAAIIASTIPSVLLADTPTLGISVLNYALTGLVIYNSKRFFLFLAINAAFLMLTILMLNIATYAHIYGFALGIAAAHLHYVIFSPRYNV